MKITRDVKKLADKMLSAFDETDKAATRLWQAISREALRQQLIEAVDEVQEQSKAREKEAKRRDKQQAKQPLGVKPGDAVSAPEPPSAFQLERSKLVTALLFGGKAGDLDAIFTALDNAANELKGLDGYEWYKVTTGGKRIQVARGRLVEFNAKWKGATFKEFASLASRAATAPDQATLDGYWAQCRKIEQFFDSCNTAVNAVAAAIRAEELWEAKKAAILAEAAGQEETLVATLGAFLRVALAAVTAVSFTGLGAAAAPAAAAVQVGASEAEEAVQKRLRDQRIDDKDVAEPNWWYDQLNKDRTLVAQRVCETQKRKVTKVLNVAGIALAGLPAWGPLRQVLVQPAFLGFFDGQVVALQKVLNQVNGGTAAGDQVKGEVAGLASKVPGKVREEVEIALKVHIDNAAKLVEAEYAESTDKPGYLAKLAKTFTDLGGAAPEVIKEVAEGTGKAIVGMLVQRLVANVLGQLKDFAAQAVDGDDFVNLMAACDRMHDQVQAARTGKAYIKN